MKTNASANLDDVRRAFYTEYVPENPESRWWWIQAVLTDPNELVVEDDESGQLYKVSFSSDDSSVVTFGEATAVRIDYIPDDAEIMKTAAKFVAATLAVGRKVLASWDKREDSILPDTDTGGAMDPKEVRKALELPEDASDADVQQALLIKAGLTVLDGGGEGGSAVTPVAPPVVAEPVIDQKPAEQVAVAASALKLPPGTVLMDESALAEIRAGIARSDQREKKHQEESNQRLVMAAIADGRIPSARKDHWLDYIKNDPEGGAQVLASLQPNIVPVAELGHARTPEELQSIEQEGEVINAWTERLFPEVAASRAGGRSRISADGKYQRGGAVA